MRQSRLISLESQALSFYASDFIGVRSFKAGASWPKSRGWFYLDTGFSSLEVRLAGVLEEHARDRKPAEE